MKKRLLGLALALLFLYFAARLSNLSRNFAFESEQTYTPHQIDAGDVFNPGAFIEFEALRISYDGEYFDIENLGDFTVRVSMSVVGVKADGSYTLLQVPAFYGTDETQYQQDVAENGWAVAQSTNMIRAGETLHAKPYIFDVNSSSFASPDPDGDGYYDITFTVHPQDSETSISASTSDPESSLYKLAAK